MTDTPLTAAGLTIDQNEIEESFVRASGPGGQNVNKLSTAVMLRFDARRSRSLPDPVAVRLIALAGRLATDDGVIVIKAQSFRTQERNREDARARLLALLERAAHVPKPRRPTKPSKAAKAKRVDAKKQRGAVKAARGRVTGDG
jgi:ribosome-associated protein